MQAPSLVVVVIDEETESGMDVAKMAAEAGFGMMPGGRQSETVALKMDPGSLPGELGCLWPASEWLTANTLNP